ncbi:MAG: hypothetical protein RLZZ502_1097 [Pseudomonadota bacterium]
MILTAESIQKINHELGKYPDDHKESAVMAALAIAQDQLGWLPPEVMQEIATHLAMPAMAVYEVASFYTMYNLEPVGQFKLTVCTNLPCALRGATQAAEYLKEKLQIGWNETTADGLFSLKEGECLGNCGEAPSLTVNNKRLCNLMSHERIDSLLLELATYGKERK